MKRPVVTQTHRVWLWGCTEVEREKNSLIVVPPEKEQQTRKQAVWRCLQAVGAAVTGQETEGNLQYSSFNWPQSPTGLSREMGQQKAVWFSPRLLSQFPEVLSIAGSCSLNSAPLPSSWLICVLYKLLQPTRTPEALELWPNSLRSEAGRATFPG